MAIEIDICVVKLELLQGEHLAILLQQKIIVNLNITTENNL
jgi:hypothetical protein